MRFRPVLGVLVLFQLLIGAAPAAAQPNYQAQVEALAAAHPAAFSCAHQDGRPCAYDFVELVACELARTDPRVGLNARRGNGALSWDAIAIADPSGPQSNISGKPDGVTRAWIIDFISGAGGAAPSVVWQSVAGPAGWVAPRNCGSAPGPSPSPGPAPSPAPAPSPTNLQPVLDALAQLAAKVEALEGTMHGFGDSVLPVLDELRGIPTVLDDQRRRVEDVLTAVDLARQQLAAPPEYQGSILGRVVVLRPRR